MIYPYGVAATVLFGTVQGTPLDGTWEMTAGLAQVVAATHVTREDAQIESTISDRLGEFRFGIAPAGKLRLHADLAAYRLIGDFTIKEEEIN